MLVFLSGLDNECRWSEIELRKAGGYRFPLGIVVLPHRSNETSLLPHTFSVFKMVVYKWVLFVIAEPKHPLVNSSLHHLIKLCGSPDEVAFVNDGLINSYITDLVWIICIRAECSPLVRLLGNGLNLFVIIQDLPVATSFYCIRE